MVELGAIDAANIGYRAIVKWSTWTGGAIMVSSGIFMFLMQGQMIKTAVISFFSFFLKGGKKEQKPWARIEVPNSWFLTGTIISGAGCIGVLYFAFHTSIVMGIVAVLTTFVLSLVACRATGETDTTPVGAMGKLTQLLFGWLAPSNIVTNLMTASITAGAAGAAADLLVDLKSGYILGANPRKQFIAQFCGIFFGTIIVVPAFYLLVPDASVLGTD